MDQRLALLMVILSWLLIYAIAHFLNKQLIRRKRPFFVFLNKNKEINAETYNKLNELSSTIQKLE
jgi:hypothetical protein